ncbi:TraR/DksA C4-type zinc finger protein [Thermoflavimicrobium dichotomicum]|uniref:Regulatory protein, yteA family n=1 Tax=Thermoflavimicrobium dichotomicum TaxID=46223 RepID=A0A1I3SZY0_9BACL|nr:TraR/DksA C4-type zinc finger protein [Thermoflavimicrobium dichotomicum]SFJ63006.1 regulatory protein, yteA family [Thermoflavimicrobium dichotomicum]
MNEEQRNQLKQQLLNEKEQLENRVNRNHHYGMESGMNDSVGELSGYDNHPADLGTEMYERGKDLALSHADERHIREIEEALKRMENGTYGYCLGCHQEIPFERLEAIPTTAYCKEHSPEQTSSIQRPIEEYAMEFYQHKFMDHSDYNGYDGEDAWQEVEQYGTSNPPDYFQDGESYNELTIDHNEQRGYVDLVEGFSITDFDGHTDEITEITHNEAYRLKDHEEKKER